MLHNFLESITPKILNLSRSPSCWKCSKSYADCENAIKVRENVFAFEDSCVGTCWGNFSLLWQEYMSSAHNVLKDGPHISDLTKRHDRHLTLSDINEKLSEKCCREDFSSVWDPSTPLLPKGVLKLHFSESIRPEILKLWRVYLFLKSSKFHVDCKNAIKVPENGYGFEDTCVGTCFGNFSLLWQEYLWSAVNVLKDGRHISDRTKRHDTRLTLCDMKEKLA